MRCASPTSQGVPNPGLASQLQQLLSENTLWGDAPFNKGGHPDVSCAKLVNEMIQIRLGILRRSSSMQLMVWWPTDAVFPLVWPTHVRGVCTLIAQAPQWCSTTVMNRRLFYSGTLCGASGGAEAEVARTGRRDRGNGRGA